MKKPLMDKLLKEVGDMGDRMALGLSHTAGGSVVNPGVSTYSSPDASQNSGNFHGGNPESYKYSPSSAGSQTDIDIQVPDDTNVKSDEIKDINKAVDSIKYKVSPDEVIMGITAELRDMVYKRPDVAKTLVIQNLKRDSTYYSKLKFLGMGDEMMNESRPHLKHMDKQQRVIADIVKHMWEKNQKRRK